MHRCIEQKVAGVLDARVLDAGALVGAVGAGGVARVPAPVGGATNVWRQSRAISSCAERRLTDPAQTASWSRFSIKSFS